MGDRAPLAGRVFGRRRCGRPRNVAARVPQREKRARVLDRPRRDAPGTGQARPLRMPAHRANILPVSAREPTPRKRSFMSSRFVAPPAPVVVQGALGVLGRVRHVRSHLDAGFGVRADQRFGRAPRPGCRRCTGRFPAMDAGRAANSTKRCAASAFGAPSRIAR